MKRMRLVVAGVGVLVLAVAAMGVALSQEQPAAPVRPCRCPSCAVCRAMDAGQEGGAQMMQRMKDAGMTDAMMQCCAMMGKMEVSPQDPAAILAMKAQLGLTDEQVQKLQAIVAASRQQAEALLTKEQKDKLAALGKPATMMQMHTQMMPMMGGMGGRRAGGEAPPGAPAAPAAPR